MLKIMYEYIEIEEKNDRLSTEPIEKREVVRIPHREEKLWLFISSFSS